MLVTRVSICGMRGLRITLFLAFICIHSGDVAADTSNQDYGALMALTKEWGNLPESWTGGDPCARGWEGISCNDTRIITITLSTMGLTGQLNGNLGSLSELQILDLSYNKALSGSLPHNIGQLSKLTSLILVGCGFSGTIPDSIGSLQQLVFLALNSNTFTGEVPASIGNLKNLYWLDLSYNQLTGSIPVSNQTTLGLDLLVNTKHFHFGINQLSGEIPPSLFSSDMVLIHVHFDNNNLTGGIPSTLGLVKTLEVIRFDKNSLNGALPTNLNNLTHVQELVLSNNAFTGPLPDLTGMKNLNYVDLSNNSFEASNVPQWFSNLPSLTTVIMERTGLVGQLPVKLFSFPLETLVLRINRINGTLDFGSSYSNSLQLIDLRNNSISIFAVASTYKFTLMLADNPFCQKSGVDLTYCNNQQLPASSYATPAFCVPPHCTSGRTSSSSCKCAYPFTGIWIFRAPSFSIYASENYFTRLQLSLVQTFVNLSLPVDSVSLSDSSVDQNGYLNVHLAVFPAGQDYFNRTGIFTLGFLFNNQNYKPPLEFGPYYFIANDYTHFGESTGKNNSKNNSSREVSTGKNNTKNNSRTGIIVVGAVGGPLLLLFLLCAVYAYHQKKRKQRANPFVSLDFLGHGGDIPQFKATRIFSFEELRKCTSNFSEANTIGSGGYGKVYRGILDNGQIAAIKRSQEGSVQGSQEFKNEIELLSRVHHKNLVNLIGFCFDQGEQMLVYEFIPNGTLMEGLSGKSGIQLDWLGRLKVALGSARGLQYLHELANPPIIHRDIKSTNILLDELLNAKVADFGISKPFGDSDTDKGYITTQVKGTMGYMDPEYFMTNQVTEKSDVFSFGVVMLEMVTARRPIQHGKYIVKEIKTTMDRTKDLYNLDEVMDPVLLSSVTMLVGFEKFVDLASRCVDESGAHRPTMSEVIKELENIVRLAGVNPNAESVPESQSYEGASAGDFCQ